MEDKKVKKEVSVAEAFERLARTCSLREMCESQAVTKMYGWGLSKDQQDEVLGKLVDARYIDNQRFATAFARDKFRFDKWGPQKIAMHLAAKRIPQDYIKAALSEIGEVDALPESVIRELERKAKSLKYKSINELRLKLAASAVRKGYSFDLAMKAVADIIKNIS